MAFVSRHAIGGSPMINTRMTSIVNPKRFLLSHVKNLLPSKSMLQNEINHLKEEILPEKTIPSINHLKRKAESMIDDLQQPTKKILTNVGSTLASTLESKVGSKLGLNNEMMKDIESLLSSKKGGRGGSGSLIGGITKMIGGKEGGGGGLIGDISKFVTKDPGGGEVLDFLLPLI